MINSIFPIFYLCSLYCCDQHAHSKPEQTLLGYSDATYPVEGVARAKFLSCLSRITESAYVAVRRRIGDFLCAIGNIVSILKKVACVGA